MTSSLMKLNLSLVGGYVKYNIANQDDWRSRWLVLRSWKLLHRVASIDWEDGEKIMGEGVTLCGRKGWLHMPGFLSRMGLKRNYHLHKGRAISSM